MFLFKKKQKIDPKIALEKDKLTHEINLLKKQISDIEYLEFYFRKNPIRMNFFTEAKILLYDMLETKKERYKKI